MFLITGYIEVGTEVNFPNVLFDQAMNGSLEAGFRVKDNPYFSYKVYSGWNLQSGRYFERAYSDFRPVLGIKACWDL